MEIEGDYRILTRLKDVKIGQRVYSSQGAVLADLENRLYVCANMFSFDRPIKGAPLVLERWGEGLGQFKLSVNDHYKESAIILRCADPIYDAPEDFEKLATELEGTLVVPHGFKGGIRDYFREFFPQYLEEYDDQMESFEEYKKENKGISVDGQKNQQIPNSPLLARIKSLSRKKEVPSSDLVRLIRKAQSKGIPLSSQYLRDIFRVD